MRLLVSIALSTGLLESCIAESPSAAPPDEPMTAAICQGGRFRCFARAHAHAETGRIRAFATAQGLGPTDLASAYQLDTSVDPHATIAIVDAYGYSTLESDLATYRSHFGLPACSTANGCLRVMNQNGQASPLPPNPPSNNDWRVETALDLDMASAACPSCKLLVVQATDDQSDGLMIAQNAAAAAGATVISNSWGGPEDSSVPSSEAYFDHPGIAIFVASGDSGYNDGGQGPDYPATSAHAIGVGGTNLTTASNARGWTERAWSSGGSSCSTNIAKPAWQTSTACAKRMSSDVAAVGDPSTGLAVYCTSGGGWTVVGGTSAASPLVAGIFALTGHGAATPAFAYQNTAAFYDVTTGTNGSCSSALCRAGAGWDGPTGVGTPNGTMLQALGGGTGSGSGSGGNAGDGSGSGGGSGSGSGAGSNGNGAVDDGPEHGGCTTTGGGASSLLVIGLALLLRRRAR